MGVGTLRHGRIPCRGCPGGPPAPAAPPRRHGGSWRQSCQERMVYSHPGRRWPRCHCRCDAFAAAVGTGGMQRDMGEHRGWGGTAGHEGQRGVTPGASKRMKAPVPHKCTPAPMGAPPAPCVPQVPPGTHGCLTGPLHHKDVSPLVPMSALPYPEPHRCPTPPMGDPGVPSTPWDIPKAPTALPPHRSAKRSPVHPPLCNPLSSTPVSPLFPLVSPLSTHRCPRSPCPPQTACSTSGCPPAGHHPRCRAVWWKRGT